MFASTRSKGKKPRSAGIAGQDYLRPASTALRPEEASNKSWRYSEGVQGPLRLHNLRHSLATFFAANEVNLPVIQSILRHAKPSTTALYTHRVTAAQMAAQEKFLAAIKVTSTTLGSDLGLERMYERLDDR